MRTQSEPFVELAHNAFHLNELHRARVVHVGDLVVLMHAEVGAGDDLSDAEKVETFQADRRHFLLIVHVVELVEAFALIVNLYPSVVRQVGEYLILRLQTKLIAELAARFRTQDVMLSLFTASRLKGALNVVKDAEAIESATLKVSVVIVGHADNLLSCLHLLDDGVVGPVEDLNVSQVERHQNKPIVAQRVEHFELSRQLLLEFKLVRREKVQLHFLVLADQRIDSNIFDKLGGIVQRDFVRGQPIVVKICVLFSDRPDNVVDQVVHQVLQIVQRRRLPLLIGQKRRFIGLELSLGLFQLVCHLVIPLLDPVQNARIFVVFVLPDLLLGLPDLLLLELRQLAVVARQLFKLVIGLRGALLVHAVTVRAIVR